jgi:hypothetical protein
MNAGNKKFILGVAVGMAVHYAYVQSKQNNAGM